ncbi:MAG TPA: DinB family protein [Blastocatellia bacterium]|nr:DinB family protein [Blastocatellia bacterium]
MSSTINDVAAQLRKTVYDASAQFFKMNDDDTSARPEPTKWSRKELLGHLIDSASNNHQRFIRAQQVEELITPKYDQEFWVSSQGYAQAQWISLVTLWREYNLHLANVIERIPEEAAQHRLVIGDNAPATLEFVVEDYLSHLKHHLQQIMPE